MCCWSDRKEKKMKRYQSFKDLVKDASQFCLVWRDVQGKPVTVLELIDSMDKNADLQPPQAYMLSEEGAIGATDRWEYAVTWILVPMEDGEEKDAILQKLETYLKS